MLLAFEANQVIRLSGLSDGNGRLALLRRWRLLRIGHRPVNIIDQFREIRRVHCTTGHMRRYNLGLQTEHYIVSQTLSSCRLIRRDY
jgi:hypothetical protein